MRFFILLLSLLLSTPVMAEFERCQGTEKSGEHCLVKLGTLPQGILHLPMENNLQFLYLL